MIRKLACATLLAILAVAATPARAESVVETMERHVVALQQKLMETKARLKDDAAPEVAELERLVAAQTKFVNDLRDTTQATLRTRLDEIEKELQTLRDAKGKADPVQEALLEQARGTLLRRLLENRIGFELDKDLPGNPTANTDTATTDAVRTGAISFRLPETADNNTIDQVRKQIARIAPNVEINYVEPMHVMTASGGDAVQLRRVQGLAAAIREYSQTPRIIRNGGAFMDRGAGGPGMGGGDVFGGGFNPPQRREALGGDPPQRAQRPPPPPEDEKKPKENNNDKF